MYVAESEPKAASPTHTKRCFPFQLIVDDQILLLKSCCMEIMCLQTACRYDPNAHALMLQNGLVLARNDIGKQHRYRTFNLPNR